MATNYSYPPMGSDFDTYRGYGYRYSTSLIPDADYDKWKDDEYKKWYADHPGEASYSVQDLMSSGREPPPFQYSTPDPRAAAYDAWLNGMPADQRAEYRNLIAQHGKAERGSFNKQALLGMAAFGGLGALAGMGGLGALGSSAAGSGMTSSMSGALGSGLTMGGGTSLGWGGLGGSGLLAGGSALGGVGAGGSLLSGLGAVGSAAGGIGKLAGAVGAIGGGLLGANQKAPVGTETRTIDPRMAAYLYGADGTSGILGGVNDLWKKQMAQGGLNDVQREGLNRQLATLRDPRYSQGFDAMRSSGLGLLGMPIAGNPYTQRG